MSAEGRWGGAAHLLGAPLYGAVLAGDVLAVPVVGGAAGEAKVGVALSDGQVARTLLGVTLSFAAAARESVLACKCIRNALAVMQSIGVTLS